MSQKGERPACSDDSAFANESNAAPAVLGRNAALTYWRGDEAALNKVMNPADGKPFEHTALEGGAFELGSAQAVAEVLIAMTFGRPPAKTQ
jgi:hypothetical protein